MASDLLLGWIIGLITVIIPQLTLEIYKLRRQLRFFTSPRKEETTPTKKKGLLDWMRRK